MTTKSENRQTRSRPRRTPEDQEHRSRVASLEEAEKLNSKVASVRLQLTLKPEFHERLKILRHDTNSTSYSEVIRDALIHYEKYISRTRRGFRIVAEKRDGDTIEREILHDDWAF